MRYPALVIVAVACACGDQGKGTSADAGIDAAAIDAPIDAAISNACEVSGAPGDCIDTTACGAIADHTSFAGHCPGAATIQCCIQTPSVSDNPPTPAGYQLMMQSEVTPEMTTWAVQILNDDVMYAMFSSTTMMFGSQLVLARVEWHPPDFQNGVVHRGVTLYEPIP